MRMTICRSSLLVVIAGALVAPALLKGQVADSALIVQQTCPSIAAGTAVHVTAKLP